jgi:hypothetical protein
MKGMLRTLIPNLIFIAHLARTVLGSEHSKLLLSFFSPFFGNYRLELAGSIIGYLKGEEFFFWSYAHASLAYVTT